MLRAELLHRDSTAVAAFDAGVMPNQAGLAPEQRFAVDQNRTDLLFGGWPPGGVDDFFHLVDRKRLAGFDWFDYSAAPSIGNSHHSCSGQAGLSRSNSARPPGAGAGAHTG